MSLVIDTRISPTCTQGNVEEWRLHLASGNSVEFFLVRFSESEFRPEWFGRSGIKCPPEVERSRRKRQAEYFHGRLVAEAALRARGAPAVHVPTGPNREPVWPEGIMGSISHTHSVAAAIALPSSRFRSVGIDVEHVVDDIDSLRQADVLRPEEARYIESVSGEASLERMATLVFSAKESFFKAAYPAVRRYFGFEALAVREIDDAKGLMELSVRQDLSRIFPAESRIRIHFGPIDGNTVFTACIE